MTINVTEKHIAMGRRLDCRGCPVFLAARDAGLDTIGVGWSINLFGGKRVSIPEVVTTFIRRFDNGEKVEPFSFEVEF